jgi:hypothetical protein
MPYIGQAPTSVAFLTDSFSGNGSTTAFTMSVAPATTSSVLVVVSGVVQDPSTYSVSGTTLTFSAAPPSGTGNISARYLGIPASGVTTTAYRTKTEFTATAGQTTFTPPSYTVGYIDVFRNGVLLGSADYTASNGTTVVLTNGANAGDLITTESFYVSSVLNAIPNTAGSVGSSNIQSSVSLTTPSITGNLTMTTGGITFNANPGGGTQSTLNDYEVGTFTATLTAATTAPTTPITTTGAYTKIGKQVTVIFGFSNVDTTGASGSLLVTGMPFSCHASIPTVNGSPMLYSLPVPQSYNVWYITGTTLNLYGVGNASGWGPVNISAGTGKYVWSTITYVTAV